MNLRIARLVLPVLAIVLSSSCGSDPTLTAIELIPATQGATVGQTVQYKATGRFIKSNQSVRVSDITAQVTWRSSNSAVATIDSAGLATAVSVGSTTITASGTGEFAGVTGSATLNVTAGSGGSNNGQRDLVSITLIPSSSTVQGAGATTQFQAIGNYSAAPLTQDLTSTATWVSSNTGVGTINSSGLATAVSAGTTTITASKTALSGAVVIATGSFVVTGGASAARDLTSITIIPASQTVQNSGDQAQFIAIGNYTSNPLTQDLTNTVTWSTSNTGIATINSAGLATATGGGNVTILATSVAPVSGSLIAATATLSNPNSGSVLIPQLTVYKVGPDPGFGIITNAGGPISCGPTCTAGFSPGTVVTLTASPAGGHTFVGWSSNCQPAAALTCTITMNGNQTVAATFN